MARDVVWALDRLFLAAMALGLLLAAGGTMLVLAGAMAPRELVPFAWFGDALAEADSLTGLEQVVAYAGCVTAIAVALLLVAVNLWAGILRRHPFAAPSERDGAVVVVRGPEGAVTVAYPILARAIEQRLARLPVVQGAAIEITGHHDHAIDVAGNVVLDVGRTPHVTTALDVVREQIHATAAETFQLRVHRLHLDAQAAPASPLAEQHAETPPVAGVL